MSDSKKLYKTKDGAMIGGVCKGFSEVYGFEVDVVRIITAVLLLFAGVPIILYLVLYLVLPNKEDVILDTYDPKDDYTVENDDYYY